MQQEADLRTWEEQEQSIRQLEVCRLKIISINLNPNSNLYKTEFICLLNKVIITFNHIVSRQLYSIYLYSLCYHYIQQSTKSIMNKYSFYSFDLFYLYFQIDINDVNQIFKELGSLVHEQGEIVDSIEANVERTENYVGQGVQQLFQASQLKNKVRRKKLYLALILAIIVTVIILIIVLTNN